MCDILLYLDVCRSSERGERLGVRGGAAVLAGARRADVLLRAGGRRAARAPRRCSVRPSVLPGMDQISLAVYT